MTFDLTTLTLIHHPICPLCREVRILFAEYGTHNWHDETVSILALFNEEKALTPFSQYQWQKYLPIIQMNALNAHTGPTAIKNFLKTLFYNVEHSPIHDFNQLSELERMKSYEMIFSFTHHFYHDVILQFLKLRLLPFEFPKQYEHSSPQEIRLVMHKLRMWLDDLERLLLHQPCFTGSFIGMSDFCVAAHISTIDYFGDIAWHTYPELKNWYARMKSRPSMRSICRDFLPAVKPVAHYKDLDF